MATILTYRLLLASIHPSSFNAKLGMVRAERIKMPKRGGELGFSKNKSKD
jgi:hypothetical protein